ncbi:Pesticidal crystal protein cry11Bb [Smittium culicis]|uniref:Pesticidal crystal protein cry11Bb n=1 Tax=Smittium culicis TaxID=133412 RepID=A0A1R1XKM6_9FUNG|nr:Pesticidal crystal protein cry11Bb [Smittium culicis]
MYSGNYGNNQGGGYDQGYNQNYNQGAGYDQNYNQGGGYDQGYNQGSGYNQGGYNQGGGYDQGYNQSYSQNDGFEIPDQDLSIEEYMNIFSDGDTAGISNITVPETVGARDLQGFDMNELQDSFSQMEQFGQTGDRGIFDAKKGKSSKMHQVIAGAAAWQALKWYENKQKKSGKKVSHSTLKKMLAAFAAAKAVKYFETSGNLQSGMTRDVVAQTAARDAVLAMETKYADENQPQYTYDNNTGYGEASTFDQFGSGGNQGGYNQNYNQGGGYDQGYNQGGYNQGGYNQGY